MNREEPQNPPYDQLAVAAQRLEHRRAEITSALSATDGVLRPHEAENGRIRVVVDGRLRLAELYLNPAILGRSDRAATIASAINEAVEAARELCQETVMGGLGDTAGLVESLKDLAQGLTSPGGATGAFGQLPAGGAFDSPAVRRLEQLLNTLPTLVGETQDRARELAARKFTGGDPDELITATVDGQGRVVDFAFDPITTYDVDNFTLGEAGQAAVNQAFDALDDARAETLGMREASDELTASEEMFDYRMGQLQTQLDDVERYLRGLDL